MCGSMGGNYIIYMCLKTLGRPNNKLEKMTKKQLVNETKEQK